MNRLLVLLGGMMVFTSAAWSSSISVSKDGTGMFSSIQDAVDAAKSGDEIVILDNGVYEEQVTIRNAFNITLRSRNPESISKPAILWRDIENVGPTNLEEANDTDKITYYYNGALRVIDSRRIIVDGIKIDGVETFIFGYPAVWKDAGVSIPLQGGNAALVINKSGEVVVRNCDISNAFMGILIRDFNDAGAFSIYNSHYARIAPLSNFGKTGNHVIEYNRIHDNSFGFFLESLNDLGTTIRYNLIYENHHENEAAAMAVVNLTSEGSNLPGGAFLFKVIPLCPVAIYNNTFWHNYLLFCGNWMPGSQHLIFNNIFGQPNVYWSKFEPFSSPWQKMDGRFLNRMKNCVYAAQEAAPTSNPQGYQVLVQNGFEVMGNPKVEGAIINSSKNGVFPVEADVRWLETRFKSTDPSSPDFLVPDWDDSLVQKYIIDKGWAEAGIKDADGTPADLGAIPMDQISKSKLFIQPLTPVAINGNTATVNFSLNSGDVAINLPVVKYCRWVDGLIIDIDDFGGSGDAVSDEMIHEMSVPNVKIGTNTLSFTVPQNNSRQFGFFEMIIEAKDQNGKSIFSNVGFLPYRKSDCILDVKVFNTQFSENVTKIKDGDTICIVIKPIFNKEQVDFDIPIRNVGIKSNSGNTLSTLNILPVDLTEATACTAIVTISNVSSDNEIITVTALYGEHGTLLGTSELLEITGSSNNGSHSAIRQSNLTVNKDHAYMYILYDLNGRIVAKINSSKMKSNGIMQNLNKSSLSKGSYIAKRVDLKTGRSQFIKALNLKEMVNGR